MANLRRLIDLDKIDPIYFPSTEMDGLDVVRYLNTLPTVDAVEVERGWWIELPGMEPDYKCFECGRSYAWWEPSEAHYCPNCGAKMDGVTDG